MSVDCHSCHEWLEDYHELAVHIMKPENRRSHRKTRIWAAKFLTRAKSLDAKASAKALREGRTPLSEEDKENRREIIKSIQLSGAKSMVNTICPKCKTRHAEALEVEYVRSPHSWKTLQGTLLIMCAGCRR